MKAPFVWSQHDQHIAKRIAHHRTAADWNVEGRGNSLATGGDEAREGRPDVIDEHIHFRPLPCVQDKLGLRPGQAQPGRLIRPPHQRVPQGLAVEAERRVQILNPHHHAIDGPKKRAWPCCRHAAASNDLP